MHVKNLTPFKIFVIKMDNHKFYLGDCWQEFLFSDFIIFSVSIDFILLFFSIFLLHFLNSGISKSFNLIITITIKIVITIKIIVFIFLNLIKLSLSSLFFSDHLLLNFNFFILHGFLHNHLIEYSSLHLHTRASSSVVTHCDRFESFNLNKLNLNSNIYFGFNFE